MSKRGSFEIKKKILILLKSSPLTYAQLERKVNTGFRTIKSNCDELKEYGFIDIKEEINKANGQISYKISITSKGKDFIYKDSKK